MALVLTAGGLAGARLSARTANVDLATLAGSSFLDADLATLAGRTVAIVTQTQMAAALAMIELDGVAARMLVCPPDLSRDHLEAAMAETGADVIVTDKPEAERPDTAARVIGVNAVARPTQSAKASGPPTEWILFTSGTVGAPKLVVHDLARLAGAISAAKPAAEPIVWSTFYDIRRYGGMQIFLRAALGRTTLVLSDGDEPDQEFLARAGGAGVTHISGTPSHWRRVLMRPPVAGFAPRYIRLSGEIADQAILDRLKAAFPDVRIVHAFASTEAGVGFEVADGKAGFPASILAAGGGSGLVAMKVEDDTLRIRSARTASGYIGGAQLGADDGFVDTGDMVDLRGERYYFVGRRGGIINVGGLKVNPEEVEAVINRHPLVQMSLVKARRNPMTGAIVVAEVVLKAVEAVGASDEFRKRVEGELRTHCRETLPVHKVPAIFKFVSALAVTAGGKLARQDG